MFERVRILSLEDDHKAVELMRATLGAEDYGCEWRHVDTREGFESAIDEGAVDLILADYSLPGYGGMAALEVARERLPDVPFIFVTGSLGEEVAIESLRSGATDYVLKDRLSRLVPAVRRALQEREKKIKLRRVEAELNYTSVVQRAILESALDSIVGLDEQFRIIEFNPSAERTFGLTREAAKGRGFGEMVLVPGGTDGEWGAVLEADASSVLGRLVETSGIRADGRLFPVEVAVARMRIGGDTAFTASLRDLGDRKQAEEALIESERRYRALFEAANDAILLLREDVMVDCNAKALAMFDAGREQIIDNSFVSLLPPTQPGGLSSVFKVRKMLDLAAHGKQQFARLLHCRLKGAPFYAELTLNMVELRDHRLIQAIVRDVTGQQQAEEAKTQLESQLRQAQKMEAMGTLAGGIAHDFNNILGAIIGYTHLAKQDAASIPSVLDSLAAVEEASHRAKDLVQQILAFSRQEEPERRLICLEDLVSEAVKLVRASLPSTIDIRTEIESGLGQVMADATQIHQVIINLSANGAHAMEGQGTLTIGLKAVSVSSELTRTYPGLKPGEYLRLSVSDTGSGMDRVTQDRIFDPFFTTKAPGEGTGLGLAVVHGIVKNHEGSITLQSAVGKGTTFRVYLPAVGMATADVCLDTEMVIRGSGQRILLVDDEPALATVGTKMLERLGYEVISCCDSVEALEKFEEDPVAFDLVITDQTMPHLEGSEMSRQMLAIRPGVPVILTTGYTTRITREECEVMGIREMLLKPLSVESLGKAVKRVLTVSEDSKNGKDTVGG